MIVANELDMANYLNNLYCRFDTRDFNLEQAKAIMKEKDMADVDNVISLDEIRSHPCKAIRPEGIYCKTSGACVQQLAWPLQNLFQLSLDTGRVPNL